MSPFCVRRSFELKNQDICYVLLCQGIPRRICKQTDWDCLSIFQLMRFLCCPTVCNWLSKCTSGLHSSQWQIIFHREARALALYLVTCESFSYSFCYLCLFIWIPCLSIAFWASVTLWTFSSCLWVCYVFLQTGAWQEMWRIWQCDGEPDKCIITAAVFNLEPCTAPFLSR